MFDEQETEPKKMTFGSYYYQNTRREIVSLLPISFSKVLELGCGEGNFRSNLKDDCEYWGVEPVASVAEVASHRLDKVLVGTYEQISEQLPSGYFDLVICNDVIEHMPDHERFLQSIKRHMASNGALVASIPNVRYIANLYALLIKKEWQYKDTGILDRTHLRFFTEKSLVRTLSDQGFQIDEIKGINAFTDKKKNGILTRMMGSLMALVLGPDTRYLQFALRASVQAAS